MTNEMKTVDGLAATAAFGSLFSQIFGWLPIALSVIASVMSIVWLSFQMIDRAERRRQNRAGSVTTSSMEG